MEASPGPAHTRPRDNQDILEKGRKMPKPTINSKFDRQRRANRTFKFTQHGLIFSAVFGLSRAQFGSLDDLCEPRDVMATLDNPRASSLDA
jgi:hypothetical protein